MNTLFEESQMDDPMFARQIELEQEMRTAGIERFRRNIAKATEKDEGSSTMTGTRLVTSAHQRMVDAINGFLAEAKSGKAGRRHTAIKFIEKLDVDVVANITARCSVDCVMTGSTMSKLAAQIGAMLEAEVNSRIFEAEMPKAHEKFLDKAKKESLARRQWSHLLFPARLLGVELEEWSDKDKVLVGTKLIDLFIEATGLMQARMAFSNKTVKQWMIEPTEATLTWIEEENARLEHLFPVWMPTIIPPKPWTSPTDGAYYSIQNRSLTLVKTRNQAYLGELAERDMPTVYASVNALQNTAWAVNAPIMDVMDRLFETGAEIAGVPAAENIPTPQKPCWMPQKGKMAREDMTEAQLAEFTEWKAAAHRTHVHNAKARTKRVSFLRTMGVAKKFMTEEAFYFPHQLDWRGRAYPIPMYLQPQGSDIQRGLLRFADGIAIADQVDADWLAIHGTGCFGFDKVALEDRVQWVKDHADEIVACYEDPFNNRFWTTADKPWQFLAFCFEWAEFLREGFGYVSYLPIQMDGTCNGLQNFSAMLLDEVGGAAVNLIPSDKPQDIYAEVAKIVAEMVEKDLFNEEAITTKRKDEDGTEREVVVCTVAELARGWHGNVNRKVCKRPVMTLAYGAKKFGFVGQVDDDTLKPWRVESPETYPFIHKAEDEGGKDFDYGYRAAMYMAGLIWDAVGKVVVAARAAMDWLQAAAQEVSKGDLPINWSTPSGLLVQQGYRVPNMKRIETTFNKTAIRLSVADDRKLGKIDARRQAAGISPNWVHSLDASHLALTIEKAAAAGIANFSMIHDSYGTHAGNAGALARILRETFVQMYAQVDVLAQFKEDLTAQTGITLPILPPKGKLDLNDVLESAFFFA